MSEMSQAQGSVGAGMDPTDDMVPPAAQSGRDPDSDQVGPQEVGSEDVGPQDYGAEDVSPQDMADTHEPPPASVPLPRVADSGGEESAPPAESSSDPMPDIAGKGDAET